MPGGLAYLPSCVQKPSILLKDAGDLFSFVEVGLSA